jgi:hypothetical protein
MLVTILKDGRTAKALTSGKVFIIQGLLIQTKRQLDPVFYSMEDRLTQLICSPGTIHKATALSNRKINII